MQDMPVKPDTWTAAVHEDGFIMSLKCQTAESTEHNPFGLPTGPFQQVKYHHLITYAF
jgi:hypothetical protein